MIILLFFVQLISAQKAWEKDWRTLKKEEAYKIINDSPWAKSYTNIDVSLRYGSLNKAPFDDSLRLAPAPPIVVRFYSSLKIRQALLRLKQLQANYDAMNTTQKAEFDEKTKNFLDCDNCKNYYVFIVLQPVSQPNEKSVIGDGLKEEQLSTLKDKIFLLNDKKEKRELAQFIAPKTATDHAVLYFSIKDEKENSLITTETKKITLQFKTSLMRASDYLQTVEFDVSKMLMDGKLDF